MGETLSNGGAARLADEFDRVFEGFGFGTNSLLRSAWTSDEGTGSWMPPIEVLRRGDRFVVRAELPGIHQGGYSCGGNGWAISIQGERRTEHEESHDEYYRSERSFGSFFRDSDASRMPRQRQGRREFPGWSSEITIPAGA